MAFFTSLCLLFVTFFCAPVALTAAPLRVALLLESEHDDLGAARLLRQGLAKAQATNLAQTEVVIAAPTSEAEQVAIFHKAAREHDMVIVAEARLHEILRNHAARFPKVKFGCIDTGVRAANIYSISFADEQAALLAGAVAAIIAAPHEKLGWIEAEYTPPTETMFAGFLNGAKLSKPDIPILRAHCGFDNPQAATAKLQELKNAGVAILVQAAGYSNLGLSDPSLRFIGISHDPSLETSNMLCNVVKRYDQAIYSMVMDAAQGKFKAKKIDIYSLANDGLSLQLSSSLKKDPRYNTITRRIKELTKEILEGNIYLQDKRIPTLCDC